MKVSIRNSDNRKQNKKQTLFSTDGGKSEWIGDGFCDDMNNQELCDYDYGDCCGAFKRNHFCIECKCIRKLIFRYVMYFTSIH